MLYNFMVTLGIMLLVLLHFGKRTKMIYLKRFKIKVRSAIVCFHVFIQYGVLLIKTVYMLDLAFLQGGNHKTP